LMPLISKSILFSQISLTIKPK